MMVFKYASAGSLRNYLDENYNKLSWSDKLNCLCEIADGLNFIHDYKIIHRDLHVSNILHDYTNASITDMGLCIPADYNASEDTKNKIYGVLPYIAPEILRGQNYTKASDIYSFGIIMYEVISGLPPYHDVSHNKNLAIKICQGLRPRFNIKVPQLIVHLIKRCLDARPLNRPSSEELNEILYLWKSLGNRSELQEQIRKVNEANENVSISSMPLISLGISYKTHSEAIYTSRLLDFNNLPEPKNSDDYYECYDNITSMEYSESQQIDVSQLKINEEWCKQIPEQNHDK
ncbi:uncharacterized protein OCT59_015264 [Rhizophagus irregularis]|nr:hypothetical protein OCT59_015264 [Rhizophagus irregularis]